MLPTFLEATTLRAALAALLSLIFVRAIGPRWIGWLKARFRDPIKCPSPSVARLHAGKLATPTMGGTLIITALGLAAAVCGDWSNPYLPIAIGLVGALAVLGACDDLMKLKTRARGLSMRAKLVAQTLIALAVSLFLWRVRLATGGALDLVLPFAGSLELDGCFIPLATLVIVGTSNAVNLTDGLDGLAGGCLVCAGAALGGVIYVGRHDATETEMLIVVAAMLGAIVGFLRFNCHPAAVFMGNTGSLPLGGLLGLVAVVARQELLLLLIGGVFVAETVSVIVQVAWFRLRGTRIFLCAPVHHHWQLRGWTERRIVTGFWIAAAVCAAVGLTASIAPLAGRRATPADSSQLAGVQQVRR